MATQNPNDINPTPNQTSSGRPTPSTSGDPDKNQPGTRSMSGNHDRNDPGSRSASDDRDRNEHGSRGMLGDRDRDDDDGDSRSSSSEAERRAMSHHRDQLAYDFREMVSSAEALLQSTASYTGAEIREARDRLQAQLHAARDRSEDMAGSMCEMQQDLMERANECVHRHPWKCIAVAFVAGMCTAHRMRR